MPHADPEERRRYQLAYWEANKDRRNAQRRLRRLLDSSAIEVQRSWRVAASGRINERNRQRYDSDPTFRQQRVESARAFGRKNVDKKRWYDRSKKYGITLVQARYIDFVRRCQATGIDLSNEGRQKVIDHDHATGRVRGVIDTKVNLAIGLLGDDPEVFKRVASYLEKTSQPGYRWDAL